MTRRPCAGLISCVKSKKTSPDKARNLYTSSLFKKSLSYVERRGLPIYILSAKYGLIPGSRIISPYNETLNNKGKKEIDEWAAMVARQIVDQIGIGRLLVLASSRYMSFVDFVENPISAPLGSLPLGKRLQFLDRDQAKYERHC